MNGTKWLSLVLWGTPAMTQKLLMEKLVPFVGPDGTIDKIHRWFFVRYWDTLPQLRFRILVSSGQGKRIKKRLEERLEPYLQAHQLWKLEWVAYRPEWERYGKDSMSVIEGLFHLQSQWAVQLFKEKSNEEKRLRELLQICPVLLNAIFSNPIEIQHYVKEQHVFFGNRLHGTEVTPKSVSKAYRKISPYINLDKNPKRECTVLANEMGKSMVQLKHSNHNNVQLTKDILHMMVNKYFLTDHAQWEFLLYEFLDRAYRSFLARQRI